MTPEWMDENQRLAKELGETKAHLAAARAQIAKLEGKDDVSEETEDEGTADAEVAEASPKRSSSKNRLSGRKSSL